MMFSRRAGMARTVLVAIACLFAASCSADQVAVWLTLTPGDQQAVLDAHQPTSHPFLACVRQHESKGDYHALNRSSGASGAYQFLDSTWRNVAPKAGVTGYGKAMHASVGEQDRVALWVLDNVGRSPWNGTGC